MTLSENMRSTLITLILTTGIVIGALVAIQIILTNDTMVKKESYKTQQECIKAGGSILQGTCVQIKIEAYPVETVGQ